MTATTGRAWRRPLVGHPDWCGQSHVCSSDRPGGTHRSTPFTFDTVTSRVVVSRTRSVSGRNRIELTIVVDLPADDNSAHTAATNAVHRVARALSIRARNEESNR